MDNEREIVPFGGQSGGDLVERSKMLFLRELVNEFRRQQQQYDLPAEFAKTRRNRSIFVPLTIVILVAVFGIVVVLLTNYIQRSSRAIDVNIQDFADVNLRDILDAAQRLQNQLAAAERELAETTAEMEGRISQLERDRTRNVQLINESGEAAAQRQQQINALNATTQEQIGGVRNEYQPRIEALNARIAELKEQIAEYDARQLEQAREQEAILNNQQRVFDIQMDGLRSEYEQRIAQLTQRYESEIAALEQYQSEFERTIRQRHAEELAALRAQHARQVADLTARFNPDLSAEATGALLSRPVPPAASAYRGPGAFDPLLGQERVIDAAGYARLVADYAEFARLMERIRGVPYINSVPDVLQQLDARARDLLVRQEALWRGLSATVVARDRIIAERDATIRAWEARGEQYRYALDELSRFSGDTGYIVDPRNEGDIVVYVSPLQSVEVGTVGAVIRRAHQFVGTIRFVRAGDQPRARIEDLEDQQSIRAYDKVLIQTR